MSNDELKTFILGENPDAVITEGKQFLTVLVTADKLHEMAKMLKESAETSFDYLFCLTGVDYPEYFEIVYHLKSIKLNHEMALKTRTVGREDGRIDSVWDIWRTAEFHEREVYDLLGVKFNNHPDLRRLFLEDGWGFPLRKDYVDEVRIIER